MIGQRAAELIDAYYDGDPDPAVAAELGLLIVADPAVARRFADLGHLEHHLRFVAHDHAAGRRRGLVSASGRFAPTVVQQRRTWSSRWLAVAAALLALAGAWWWNRGDERRAMIVLIDGAIHGDRDGQPFALRPFLDLHDGDRLSTDAGASLVLRLADESVVRIAGDSRLVCAAVAAGPDGRLRLERGRLEAVVAHQPAQHRFVIATPEAEIAVIGTSFAVSVAPGRTRLAVSEGVVRFTDLVRRTTALVVAGQETDAAASDAPAPGLAVARWGIWQDITPKGLDLSPDLPKRNGERSNYGVQDVLADPARPGRFYAFACYQGCWRSDDWGDTWARVSSDGNLEKGRPWGEAIAPDGSYLLACTGYGPIGAWKSSDGGATWTNHPLLAEGGHPNSFAIDPAGRDHVIASSHGNDHIAESKDGGETWSDRGPSGAGLANHIFFISPTTWLAVGEMDSGCGTRRTTDSGASWTKVGVMEHPLGTAQVLVDADHHAVYVPALGMYRSTDDAASFSKVSDDHAGTVFATATRLYSIGGGLANQGPVPATLFIASRGDGTDWTAFPLPAAMTNLYGAKRAAVAFNPSLGAWVIVSGNWLAGIWRCIEK